MRGGRGGGTGSRCGNEVPCLTVQKMFYNNVWCLLEEASVHNNQYLISYGENHLRRGDRFREGGFKGQGAPNGGGGGGVNSSIL